MRPPPSQTEAAPLCERESNRSLHGQHPCQLDIDVRVVVVAVKLLCVHAAGEHGHRQSGVAIRGEGDAGLVVENVCDGHGERLIGAVSHILRLLDHTGILLVDAFFVGGFQQTQLVVRHHQLIALVSINLQSEQRLNVAQNRLEGSLGLFIALDIVAVELGVGDFLAVQQGDVGIIVGSGKADGQTAGLMVAGNQDQRLVGVGPGKVDGDLYCQRQFEIGCREG